MYLGYKSQHEAEGGRMVKEWDFEAEKNQNKTCSYVARWRYRWAFLFLFPDASWVEIFSKFSRKIGKIEQFLSNDPILTIWPHVEHGKIYFYLGKAVANYHVRNGRMQNSLLSSLLYSAIAMHWWIQVCQCFSTLLLFKITYILVNQIVK